MNQKSYQNSNMDQRPSNASLVAVAVLQLVVVGFAGLIITSAILMFIRGLPFDSLSLVLIAFGMTVGLATFLLQNFKYAKRQKAAYIAAGGDPTGITLFMFGAMGGKLRSDGIWEWKPKHDYSA